MCDLKVRNELIMVWGREFHCAMDLGRNEFWYWDVLATICF